MWMFALLPVAGAVNPLYPRGTYYASVSPLALPVKQEIKIVTLAGKRARIELNGLVEMNDEFEYDFADGAWVSNFSSEFETMLRKWRCKFLEFDYDGDKDVAIVLMKVPIIGLKRITLKEVSRVV